MWQRQDNTAYVATEAIRTAKVGGYLGSPFKNLVSDHLTASNVNDSIIRFFSDLGICKSKSYLTISSDKGLEKKIKEGWDPIGCGYGIIVGAYDNIGFRK